MGNNVFKPVLAMLLAFAVAAPAWSKDAADSGNDKNGTDLNAVVCEKIKVTGSRLDVKRVCKTRAEWADLKLQDRQEIERVQTQRGSCEGCQ